MHLVTPIGRQFPASKTLIPRPSPGQDAPLPDLGRSLSSFLLAPRGARACACGCGIYEVGTSSMIPTGAGIETFFDYDYQDQNQNWSGSSEAPAADNDDKNIRTSWYNARGTRRCSTAPGAYGWRSRTRTAIL